MRWVRVRKDSRAQDKDMIGQGRVEYDRLRI